MKWLQRTAATLFAGAIAAGGLVAVTGMPAFADSGDYGVVWDATPTLPDQWFTAGGRTAEIVRSSAGVYTVIFTGRANAGGNVEVSADTTGSGSCQVGSWWPSGADERVTVLCFDATGAAADVAYHANFVYRSGTGGRYAYAWANNPTTTAAYTPASTWAYDSTGATIQIQRWRTGSYWVYVPATVGVSWKVGESFQATAYGSTPAHCQVSSSMHDDGWQEVTCRDMSGNLRDTYFAVSFASQRSYLGIGGVGYAYAWLDGTVSPPGGSGLLTTVYAYDQTGATGTAAAAGEQQGTGRYYVKLYHAMTADEPFPIAYATNGYQTYCSVTAWSTSGTTEYVWVSCIDEVTHAPAQSAFMLQFVSLPH